jgi:hypothetical protein
MGGSLLAGRLKSMLIPVRIEDRSADLIINIYAEAFTNADCCRLSIPENAMAGDIYSSVERSL